MAASAGPTIRTVATEAGVSVATVSYVLSGRSDRPSRVSAPTRARVEEAARRLGYEPNQAARGMRRGSTGQVCLAMSTLQSYWSQTMADVVSQALAPAGYTTILLARSDAWVSYLRGRGADAAFVDTLNGSAEELQALRSLADRGLALVVISPTLEPEGFDVIRPIYEPALSQSVDLLTGRHERVGYLSLQRIGKAVSMRRFDAYAEGLRRAGRQLDDSLVVEAGQSMREAYRLALQLLQAPSRPTAVFGSSDEAALAVLAAASKLDIAVPDELEVVAFGNTPAAIDSDLPLTGAGPPPVFDMVAELLRTRLTGTAPPEGRLELLPWQLHVRATTR